VFASDRLTTAVERARHVAGVVETRAGRLMEHAKESYREVEELAQTRAGRVRVLVSETFHLLGRRATLRADEDVAIAAPRIELG
jgi:hypothetical protein